MISDEMRELLSVYVDGELRDSDAARVEEMSKRDPELRREIEAYRILSRRLEEWDEAELEAEPAPPTLMPRALARAQGHCNEMREQRRGRLHSLFTNPLLAAAGLLLAAFVGLGLARDTMPQSVTADAPDTLGVLKRQPYQVAEHQEGVVKLGEMARLPKHRPLHPLLEQGLRGYLIDGRVWTKTSLQLLVDWSEEHQQMAYLKALSPPKEETRTGTWRPEVLAMLRGYKAAGVPYEGLVVIGHQVALDPPALAPILAGARIGMDHRQFDDQVILDLGKLGGGARLMLAGEVLIGGDASKRARVINGSSWVKESSPVPITWADATEIPSRSRKLVLQSEMLGPRARRALVASAGRDAQFLAWLKSNYRGGDLAKLYRSNRSARDKAVARLMEPLHRNLGATGFAVVAGGKVLGVELFASHELMTRFAPRLLHGYLVEANGTKISLKPPTRGVDELSELARGLMDRAAQTAIHTEQLEGSVTDEWEQAKMSRRNILGTRGKVIGHGLLHKGRPLHVTLFGD